MLHSESHHHSLGRVCKADDNHSELLVVSVNHVVMTTQPPPCMLGDETVVVYNTVEGFLFYLEKQSSSGYFNAIQSSTEMKVEEWLMMVLEAKQETPWVMLCYASF